jgi:hypothetical protein
MAVAALKSFLKKLIEKHAIEDIPRRATANEWLHVPESLQCCRRLHSVQLSISIFTGCIDMSSVLLVSRKTWQG